MVGLDATAQRRCRGDAAPVDAARALQGQARRQGRHADARRAWRLPEIRRVEGGLLAERARAALDEFGALNAPLSWPAHPRSSRGQAAGHDELFGAKEKPGWN